MIPSVSSPNFALKATVSTQPQTGIKTSLPGAPDIARTSVGETAAGNTRAETALAVEAPDQTPVPPRLRDQETAERSQRQKLDKDAPAGPRPAFDESLLERQVRLAFDPPESKTPTATATRDESPAKPELPADKTSPDDIEIPPTPREKAEVSFAETRTMTDPRETATVDVSR
jgi:hypothetical protein